MRRTLKVALAFLFGAVLVVVLLYLATGIFEAIFRVSGSAAVATMASAIIAAALYMGIAALAERRRRWARRAGAANRRSSGIMPRAIRGRRESLDAEATPT